MEGQLFSLLETVVFAIVAHKNQVRKDKNKTPYICHPIEVAEFIRKAYIVTGVPVDENVLKAAILHDVVEDTPFTIQHIASAFGNEVAGIVAQVSDNKSLSKVERKMLQIEHAEHATLEAKLVKLGDKWSNCRELENNPPKGWSDEMIRGYLYWSYAVCKATNPESSPVLAYMWDYCLKVVFDEIEEDALESELQKYYALLK